MLDGHSLRVRIEAAGGLSLTPATMQAVGRGAVMIGFKGRPIGKESPYGAETSIPKLGPPLPF